MPAIQVPQQRNSAIDYMLMGQMEKAKAQNTAAQKMREMEFAQKSQMRKMQFDQKVKDQEFVIRGLKAVSGSDDPDARLADYTQGMVGYFGQEKAPDVLRQINAMFPGGKFNQGVADSVLKAMEDETEQLARQKQGMPIATTPGIQLRDPNTGKAVGPQTPFKKTERAIPDIEKYHKYLATLSPNSKKWKDVTKKIKIMTEKKTNGQTISFKEEKALRDEFRGLSKAFREVTDTYGKLRSAVKKPTAVGDLSLIFQFYRMQEPESIVRESEFAIAAASGNLGDRFIGVGKKLVSGKRFSDAIRADFVDKADQFYEAQSKVHANLETEYTKLAESYKLNPERVVINYRIKDLETGKTAKELVVGDTYRNKKGDEKIFLGVDKKTGKKKWKDK